MTEVVLDVKLASLGVLNISPGGLADLFCSSSCLSNRLGFSNSTYKV